MGLEAVVVWHAALVLEKGGLRRFARELVFSFYIMIRTLYNIRPVKSSYRKQFGNR